MVADIMGEAVDAMVAEVAEAVGHPARLFNQFAAKSSNGQVILTW